MKDSADLTIRHSQAPRTRGGAADASSRRRFSPLNAPQRAAVEAFCKESRAWALRQAGRTYRHLPEELREQAVDAAMRELRTGAPVAVDRRTLHAELAFELTAALRRVHIGWCLNQSTALFREDGLETPPAAPDGEQVASFINEGLGGLERAVLQLEIGAGRDTRTARAALRLGPRQYSRHREEGLSKLRDAITGTVAGHVCDDHVAHVVLAATGDRAAADALASGSSRCRACSREAQGLRRLLHERLALAPWPFVVKPAGLLAAKAAAITAAVTGGKGASAGGAGVAAAGFGSGSVGSGAGVMASVLAAAAVATGGATLVKHDDAAKPPVAKAAAAKTSSAKTLPTSTVNTAPKTAPKAAAKPAGKRAGTHRQTAATRKKHPSAATKPAATSTPSTGSTTTPTTSTTPTTPAPTAAPVTNPVKQTTDTAGKTVNNTVDQVQDTADKVVAPVAPQLQQPVDDLVDTTQQTVDQVTNTVGGLLNPPK